LNNPKKVIAFPDIHFGAHDDSALNLGLAFNKDWKADEVILLGDVLETESIGRFASPYAQHTLEDEFDLANDFLDKLSAKVVYLEGNHEYRLRDDRYVPQQLQRCLSVSKNLHLNQRKIKFIPYRNDCWYKVGKMKFIHGFCCNMYAAKAEAETYGCVCHGHTHRIQSYQPRHAFHKNTGFNIGCLCKLDMDYQARDRARGWAQGFAFGYFFKSGNFSFYQVRLIGNQFVIEGKEYKR